ncbi:hypothetical protein ANFP_01830 [Acidithiobacillus ferrooxidans]|nr:hypothetical protein ANFP_01830 [Acidithiobacillus ferrooxidans]
MAMGNTNQSFEWGFIPSPKGQSRSISYQGRDLLTADEVLRLRSPEKRGSDIVKACDMIISVAHAGCNIAGCNTLRLDQYGLNCRI